MVNTLTMCTGDAGPEQSLVLSIYYLLIYHLIRKTLISNNWFTNLPFIQEKRFYLLFSNLPFNNIDSNYSRVRARSE